MRILILVLGVCLGGSLFGQFFDAEKHPPQFLIQENVDVGAFVLYPNFASPPTFDSDQNRWIVDVRVRNALTSEFILGTSTY
jgi:hypothetical protein